MAGGGARRRSGRARGETLDKIHEHLKRVQVSLSKAPSIGEIRETFARIRTHRNVVARILASLLPLSAKLRADLVLIERVIERQGAHMLDTGQGMLGATNDKLRAARIKVVLSEDHDVLAEVRADAALVDEAVGHAKLVREELRYAYEEASRALASIDLEYRIETSAP